MVVGASWSGGGSKVTVSLELAGANCAEAGNETASDRIERRATSKGRITMMFVAICSIHSIGIILPV